MTFAQELNAQHKSTLAGVTRCVVLVSFLILVTAKIMLAQAFRSPDTTYADGSNKIQVYKELDLTVLSVHHGFEYVFIAKNVAPFAAMAREKNFRFMINASFFDGDRLDAQPSGWLHILGASYGSVWDNRQLTHIVRYDTITGKTDIVSSNLFKPSETNHTIEFQTGPLIIRQNCIDTALIANSINGPGKYTRTLLAIGGTGELWFVTVRKPVALDSLGAYLLTLSPFQQKRIDVVNLDGGPSVAFYSRAFPTLNYNVDDRLPLLLGVK
jgi:hypothetical protein